MLSWTRDDKTVLVWILIYTTSARNFPSCQNVANGRSKLLEMIYVFVQPDFGSNLNSVLIFIKCLRNFVV